MLRENHLFRSSAPVFLFPNVGALDAAAADAIIKPANAENVDFDAEAVEEITRQTKGYPYFLQEWGKHAWDCADAITFLTFPARKALTRLRYGELASGRRSR